MSDTARAERLKAALRENLKRRKAQSRGRARSEAPSAAEDRSAPRDDDAGPAGNSTRSRG